MALASSARLADLHALPRVRRPRRLHWIGAVVAIALALYLLAGAALTPGFEWRIVGAYLFEPRILQGVWISVVMTAVTMVLSAILGVLVALLRMSSSVALSALARGFIWVFRAVPMLVQLLFWYNLAALFPRLGLGIPGLPPVLSVDANSVITPLTAAVIGLTLHETAYLAEIFRSGFLAVPRGQREAADALGLTPQRTFLRIVLPQALRIIVPTLGNEVISLLKATSLVSVIALSDLLYTVQLIYASNYQTIPLLVVACIWYMVITGLLSLVQSAVEKRLANRAGRPSRRLVLEESES